MTGVSSRCGTGHDELKVMIHVGHIFSFGKIGISGLLRKNHIPNLSLKKASSEKKMCPASHLVGH